MLYIILNFTLFPICLSTKIQFNVIKNSKFADSNLLSNNKDFKRSSVPYLDSTDNYLLANITIGNPAQALQLRIDINTDEFWVICKECKAVQCRGLKGHMYPFREKQQYNATASSSARPTTQKFGLGFGQGFVSGTGVREQVTVGDITLSNREVAAASNIQLFFGYEPADGVLGLGFEEIKPGAKPNWELPINSLLANKNKIYSLQLSEAGHKQFVGEINFGEVDKEICSEQVEFIESIDEKSWKLRLDGIRVSDVKVGFNGSVALDPASVFIQAPNDLVNAIYNVIKPIHMSYWGYVMECDKISETPSIFINLNGIELEIESKNYILDLDYGGGLCALTLIANSDAGFGGADLIIGEPLLRQYCYVFDIANKRVGFARNLKL